MIATTWSEQDDLRAFLKERYAPHMLRGRKASTLNKYHYAIDHFGRYLGRPPRIGDLEELQLTDFVHQFARAPSTTNGYLSKLRRLATYAHGKGILAELPFVLPLPTYDDEPIALTPAQFAAVIHAARRMEGWIAYVPRSLWLEALAWAVFDTAFRVGALLSLRWSGLEATTGTIYVRGEDQKTGKFARRAIHRDTMALLLRMRNPLADDDHVWPFPWADATGFYNGPTRRLFALAGLPDSKDYKWHAIRKLMGTLVADQFGDAAGAEYLQHSNIDTFRRHYKDGRQCSSRVVDEIPRPEV